MLDFTGTDLRQTVHTVAVKKAVSVQAQYAEQDGAVSTLEGCISYRKGDYILTGCAGESWPVTKDYFEKYYSRDDSGSYTSSSYTVLAVQPEESFCVSRDGGLLCGEPGDWLVQYESGDHGIVNSTLFAKLYDIN